MPYMAVCRICNYHYFSVSRKWAEEFIVEHIGDKHPESLFRYVIARISDALYEEFLKNRDNPAFWRAIRNYRKFRPNSHLFDSLKGENCHH